MCGIAGAFDLTGRREFPASILNAMTDALAHRGPDDRGAHREPGVALGARRLAIVDLAGGRQPIANEDRNVWVAFNGELFDYAELRGELLARGHKLTTRCDTEVWVHLYEDRGEAMFSKTRGQFAVSLWDRTTRTLVLARDRVGICPLYYAERDGWLLWASEIKGLLASGLVAPRVDPKGIDHLFTFFCQGTERTFFEGVNSLGPGRYLVVRDGRIASRRHWDLDFPDAGQERRSNNPNLLTDELEHLLRRSVERRLRGDVPVVAYISGGLDSTVVLGLSSSERGRAVPSFTIGFDGAGPDERAHAAESAERLGSPLTLVTLDRPGIAEAFPELTVAAEGPVLDTSCAALLRLARTVHAQGYKVVLTGEGADEALAGYVWYKSQRVREAITRRIGAFLPRLCRNLLLNALGGRSKRPTPWRAVAGVRPAQQDLYELLARTRSVLYSPDLWDRLGDHDPYSELDIPADRIRRWHPLNQSLYVGYKVMLPGLLMVSKGDRIAMHSSVETRYPFLDEDVIDFCATIAPEYKLRGSTEKWLLRQAAARILPAQIASRPKTMFRASLSGTFLDDRRPAWVDQLLSPESLRASGCFDAAAVLRQRFLQTRLPKITPARFVYDLGLAAVAAVQLWHHLFIGGGLCDLPAWSDSSFAGNRSPAPYREKEPPPDEAETLSLR